MSFEDWMDDDGYSDPMEYMDHLEDEAAEYINSMYDRVDNDDPDDYKDNDFPDDIKPKHFAVTVYFNKDQIGDFEKSMLNIFAKVILDIINKNKTDLSTLEIAATFADSAANFVKSVAKNSVILSEKNIKMIGDATRHKNDDTSHQMPF